MQVKLADFVERLPERQELRKILRSCVHCGICNSVCPTYQLLGDERDGPRGRIYLLKQFLEGGPATRLTQQHLDRCLHCGACESACPSGVRYGRLLDVGRAAVATQAPRSLAGKLLRRAMLAVFPFRQRFAAVLSAARAVKPLLPQALQKQVPRRQIQAPWPAPRHARKMLILPGCVQPALAPSIDAAAARVLDKLGISLLPVNAGGCCGALSYHLDAHAAARHCARANIDACRPYLAQGAEAIVSTASGCGAMLKDYGELLQHDPEYAAEAAQMAALAKDLSEILRGEELCAFKPARPLRIAFQSPCTLQHAQKLAGVVEDILRGLGHQLLPVADAHLCCGSAGVYSLLQPRLSGQLLRNKLHNLQQPRPDVIATANIGCQMHLQAESGVAVVHWIELLAAEDNQFGR